MIEVMIDSVRVNLMSPQRLVILREVGSDRYLPDLGRAIRSGSDHGWIAGSRSEPSADSRLDEKRLHDIQCQHQTH